MYLKQVGIIVYLAHCGAIRPAPFPANCDLTLLLADARLVCAGQVCRDRSLRSHSVARQECRVSSEISFAARNPFGRLLRSSVSSSLSTFSSDASQMSYILRHCTERSLCLIDEFGKGTAAFDGIALMAR